MKYLKNIAKGILALLIISILWGPVTFLGSTLYGWFESNF